jgi:hypothetical protein
VKHDVKFLFLDCSMDTALSSEICRFFVHEAGGPDQFLSSQSGMKRSRPRPSWWCSEAEAPDRWGWISSQKKLTADKKKALPFTSSSSSCRGICRLRQVNVDEPPDTGSRFQDGGKLRTRSRRFN